GRLTGRRIARDRGATRVVAVEAEPGVRVDLGAAPGTSHDSALRADDRRVGSAAVRWIDRVDSKSIAAHAPAGNRPPPRRPRDVALPVDRVAGLQDRILPYRAKGTARFGVGQPDAHDVVVPDLHANRVLQRACAPSVDPAVADLRAGHDPAIVLMN